MDVHAYVLFMNFNSLYVARNDTYRKSVYLLRRKMVGRTSGLLPAHNYDNRRAER